MNPDLQKELALWLSAIREGAQQGASFAIEQAPLVVQEKILYGRITSLLLVLLAVVAFVLSVRVYRSAWAVNRAALANGGKGYCDIWPETQGAMQCVLSFVAACGSLVFAIAAGNTAVLAWCAPRLYIIEWLSELLVGQK